MSLRAVAVGTLKFREVAVPVKLYLAAKEERLSFKLIHAECLAQVSQQLWCAQCQRVLDRKVDCAHGLPNGEETTVFTSAELDAMEPEADGVFEVVTLRPAALMEPIRLDGSTYYVGVDSKASRDAYRTMFAAVTKRKKIGLVRLVLYGRRRFAVLLTNPIIQRFTLAMLYYAGEVRDAIDAPGPEPRPVVRTTLALATQLVDTMDDGRDLFAETADEQRARLLEFVEQRKAGQAASPGKAAPVQAPAAVLDLNERLRASLGIGRPGGIKARRNGDQTTKASAPGGARGPARYM
jgi:DNA end-binding protein Ku